MWGKFFVLAILVLFCIQLISAQECTRDREIDPRCERKNPYCVEEGNVNTCVECLTDCDCGNNEYCSTASAVLDEKYRCKKFKKAGKSCLPYSLSDIADPNVDKKYKCAETLMTGLPSTLVVDHVGECIGGTCRFCTPSDSIACGSDGYLGEPRQCAFPGSQSSVRMYSWQVHEYSRNPIFVWLAIFFVFIFIMLVVNIVLTLKSFRK